MFRLQFFIIFLLSQLFIHIASIKAEILDNMSYNLVADISDDLIQIDTDFQGKKLLLFGVIDQEGDIYNCLKR